MKVASILTEVHMNLSARLKERAVFDNLLCELQFENDLVDVSKAPLFKSVSEDLVIHSATARAKMNSSLMSYVADSGVPLATLVRNKDTKRKPCTPPTSNHHHH